MGRESGFHVHECVQHSLVGRFPHSIAAKDFKIAIILINQISFEISNNEYWLAIDNSETF